MRKIFFIVLSILISVIVIIIFLYINKFSTARYVKIGNEEFVVTVALTEEEKSNGLSVYKDLPDDEGMLFVFGVPDKYSFWMKDMNFAIDIIWIDENFSVVHIEKNVSPTSYPKTFTPSTPALYVLEVNSGIVDTKNIKIGDSVSISY